MFRRALLVIATSVGLGSPMQAQVFTGGPLFDGYIHLDALRGESCVVVPEAPGKRYPAVFRAKNAPDEGPAEAISMKLSRGALFITAVLDETFEGRRQIATGSFIFDASRAALPDAVLNLEFSRSPVGESTGRFKFEGTWRNFRERDCIANIRGVFKRRD